MIKPDESTFWKEQIDRLKFIEESKKVHQKATVERKPEQKIKLIVNVIVPDNFDKKFRELRRFIFGEYKFNGEAGYN